MCYDGMSDLPPLPPPSLPPPSEHGSVASGFSGFGSSPNSEYAPRQPDGRSGIGSRSGPRDPKTAAITSMDGSRSLVAWLGSMLDPPQSPTLAITDGADAMNDGVEGRPKSEDLRRGSLGNDAVVAAASRAQAEHTASQKASRSNNREASLTASVRSSTARPQKLGIDSDDDADLDVRQCIPISPRPNV